MAGEFPPRVVRLVFEVREGSRCFKCLGPLRWEDRGFGWSLHHRKPRGMGGSKAAWASSPANGLVLCGSGTTGCHGWVESHRDEAYARGLLVYRNSRDVPADVPVQRDDGRWFELTDWGSAVEA